MSTAPSRRDRPSVDGRSARAPRRAGYPDLTFVPRSRSRRAADAAAIAESQGLDRPDLALRKGKRLDHPPQLLWPDWTDSAYTLSGEED